jgi:hypothetical protein
MGIKITPSFAQAIMMKLFWNLMDFVECFIDNLVSPANICTYIIVALYLLYSVGVQLNVMSEHYAHVDCHLFFCMIPIDHTGCHHYCAYRIQSCLWARHLFSSLFISYCIYSCRILRNVKSYKDKISFGRLRQNTRSI